MFSFCLVVRGSWYSFLQVRVQLLCSILHHLCNQYSGDVTSIKCQHEELDTEGNHIKTLKTDITYTY